MIVDLFLYRLASGHVIASTDIDGGELIAIKQVEIIEGEGMDEYNRLLKESICRQSPT